MIEPASIISWRSRAPWRSDAQVEQDLILSRALIDIFKHPVLSKEIVFRGGTALQKLFYPEPNRYSEDLDFVQIKPGGIGVILDSFKEKLDPWLGKPKKKFNEGRVTLLYGFEPSLEKQISNMKVKIEINTREHFNVMDLIKIPYEIDTPWYVGKAEIITYQLEELLGTKLRALYQRKKGRDLFDLAMALKQFPVNISNVLHCFNQYLMHENLKISRAEFEENLNLKFAQLPFRDDILALLPESQENDQAFEENFQLVLDRIVQQLSGEPWKGKANSNLVLEMSEL